MYHTKKQENNTTKLVLYICALIISIVVLWIYVKGSAYEQQTNNSWPIKSDLESLVDLWETINGPWKVWPGVGFCRNGSSLISGISDSVCHRRKCLYSPTHDMYIDLGKLKMAQLKSSNQDFAGLEKVRWTEDFRDCYRPSGGQLPVPVDADGKRKRIEVSFLYTLHNNADLSAASILEVFRTANEAATAEFVIVDDGSTEDMSPVYNLLNNLEYFFKVPIITRTHNVSTGYLYSNNEGMQIANGEFVVLLNSDVLVLPGWLKMLLRTIHSFPSGRVGMVGSMMLDTEGNIMEAGGGIFRFGQPFNMGRGFMPSDLPLQQARVVDYVSAACLLVRRKLFLTLGLFDPKYAPAYFEDTDAGLVHAEHGWKTILQPLSVVVHLEGSSYGKSGKSNVKDNLMEQNAQKFADSHKMLLESSCPAPRYDLPLHTESRLDVHTGFSFYRQPNRVLFLEDIVPEPDRDAGSIRLAALLHILTELGMTVTFESQYVPGRNIRYLLSLFADGVNAVMPGTLRDMASNAVALRTSSALSHVYSRINLCPYDLVIIARRDVFTERIADVKTLCPNVPIVFDTVDVHFIRELRMYNISNQQKKDKEVELQHIHSGRKLELGHMKLSNVTLVVSTEEQRILQELLGEKADIRVISNIYKVESESKSATTSIDDGGNRTEGGDVSTQRRSGAVFVGNMCHHPNIDAVDFIVRHILNSEHAKSKFPKDFKMHFVWSRSQMCPNKVLEEAKRHPMVVVHRDISNDELLLLHQKVKIVLAPLRYGAGVKGKVNYALLHGVPVIATKIAAEGMGLVHETNCLLAETGEEFAIAISRISDEEALFQKLTKGGKDIMRKLFGRDIAKDKMRQVIQDMGISLPTAGSSDANQVTVRNSTGTTGNMQQHHTCQHLKEFELYREELGSFWRVEKHLMPSPRTRAKKKSATRKKVKRNGILLHDEGVVFPVYPRFPFSRDFIQYV